MKSTNIVLLLLLLFCPVQERKSNVALIEQDFRILVPVFDLARRQPPPGDAALALEPKCTGGMWPHAASGGLTATEVVAGGAVNRELLWWKPETSQGWYTEALVLKDTMLTFILHNVISKKLFNFVLKSPTVISKWKQKKIFFSCCGPGTLS